MTRRLVALLGLLAGLLGAALLLAGPAAAHATVVSSTPADGTRLQAAPRSVQVTFDEAVGLGNVSYLHVTDQTGRRVDTGAARHPGGAGDRAEVALRSGLGDGTYTASFRVVSADSHPVAGTIRFVVGDGALARGSVGASGADPTTERLFDAVRWVSYVGLAVLGGVWLVLTVWPAGRDDRRARRLVWSGWGALAFGTLAEVLVQGPYTAGLSPLKVFDPSLIDATLHTDFGQLHSLRLLLLGVLAVFFARSLQADARPVPWEGAAALVGIGVAATFSSTGHAGTTSPTELSVPLDMLHLLSMSTWVGGLIMLLGAVLPRRDADELRAVLPVFSRVAFVSVIVLAVSGSYAALRGIGDLDAIFGTTYGLLIVGKILLFVGLLVIANASRLVVQRRVQVAYAYTADADADDDVDAPAERLRRSVLVEVVGAVVVLALTAVLVAEPRGREALAAQAREAVSSSAALGGGSRVVVSSDPGTHGTVTVTVEVTGGAAPTRIAATATQTDKRIGPVPVKLTKADGRTWTGTAPLTVAGPWRFNLVVTRSEFDAVNAQLTVRLN